jgi:hypothetical protein
MKTNLLFAAVAIGTIVAAPLAWAQRGIGQPQGVARQAVLPDTETIAGTLERIEIGPCESTTGHASVGLHLHLRTDYGDDVNLHAGPAANVKPLLDQLRIGDSLSVVAFRTENHRPGHYVAQKISSGDQVIDLRDENLRPQWAGTNAARQPGQGRGQTIGQGPGQGRGQAMGQGRPRGAGQGPALQQGRGPGRGQGLGQAAGQGAGQGRGQGRGQGPAMGRGQGRGPGRGPAGMAAVADSSLDTTASRRGSFGGCPFAATAAQSLGGRRGGCPWREPIAPEPIDAASSPDLGASEY